LDFLGTWWNLWESEDDRENSKIVLQRHILSTAWMVQLAVLQRHILSTTWMLRFAASHTQPHWAWVWCCWPKHLLISFIYTLWASTKERSRVKCGTRLKNQIVLQLSLMFQVSFLAPLFQRKKRWWHWLQVLTFRPKV